MKSFNSLLTNKTFRKIYKEEAIRFGKILKEYDESQNNMYIRAIKGMISDTNRFTNTEEVRKLLKNELNTKDTEIDSIETALKSLAVYNPEIIKTINLKVQRLLKTSSGNKWSPASGGTDASKNPSGGGWTGD